MTGKGCKLLDCIPHSCLPSFGGDCWKTQEFWSVCYFWFSEIGSVIRSDLMKGSQSQGTKSTQTCIALWPIQRHGHIHVDEILCKWKHMFINQNQVIPSHPLPPWQILYFYCSDRLLLRLSYPRVSLRSFPSQISWVRGGRMKSIDFVLQIAHISSSINPLATA